MTRTALLRCAFAATSLVVTASCASTQRYDLRSGADYEAAFRATAQTLPTLNWFIVSSDTTTGIITATRGVPGARTTDRQLRLSLLLQRSAGGTEIEATFIPPGMAFGTADGEFEELKAALVSRLPDAGLVRK